MAWRSDAGIRTGAPENAVFGPDTRIFGGLIGGLISWPKNAPARIALVVASADAVYPVRDRLEV